MMKNIFKTLNSIQTHLLIWGNPFDCKGRDVIICITGNPGVTDYYIEFGSAVHKSTGLDLCVIGQAGHEVVPEKRSNELHNQEHLFNLEGQIQHKIDLINDHIDKKSKLHLIGHSIGSWLILEMLQKNKNITERLSSVNLLFPTIQNMAITKNGKYLNHFIRKLHVFVILLLKIINLLPEQILHFIVRIYLTINKLPLQYTERIMKYLDPKIMEKVLFLAYNEMDCVKALNTRSLDNIKHITNIIYGSEDGWVPHYFIEDLTPFEPHLKIKKVDVEHAFVLRSSEKIADMVSGFIKST